MNHECQAVVKESLTGQTLHVDEDDCCRGNVRFVIDHLSRAIAGLKVCPAGEELVPELDLGRLRTRERLTAVKDGKTINEITAFWLGEALADTDCLIRLTTGAVKNLAAIRNNARIYLSPEDNRDPINKRLLQGALRLKSKTSLANAKSIIKAAETSGSKTLSFKCLYLGNNLLDKLKPDYERFVTKNVRYDTDLDLSHNLANEESLVEFLCVSKRYGELDLSSTSHTLKTMKLFCGCIARGALQVHTLNLRNVGLTGTRLNTLIRAYSSAPASTQSALEHLDLSENDTSYPMCDWKLFFRHEVTPFPKLKTLSLQPHTRGESGQGDLLIRGLKQGALPSIEKVVVQTRSEDGFQVRVTSAVRAWLLDSGIKHIRAMPGKLASKLSKARRAIRFGNERPWYQPALVARYDALKTIYDVQQSLSIAPGLPITTNEFLDLWSDPGTPWRNELRTALATSEAQELLRWGSAHQSNAAIASNQS